jgi:uncharacterized iron-regulated membrane protein
MKKKKNFKYWIGRLHFWLGLSTGLIVFIVSITGCLYCFHDEIKDVTRPYRHVEQRDQPFLAPSVLFQNAMKRIPENKPSFIVYAGKNRSVAVYTSGAGGQLYIYFDPYTGQYLATENLKKDFFIIVEYSHLYLLLPPAIGKKIVGVSIIIFVVMLITGIVLWWPRRKHDRKLSFTIKWNSRWRRVNYDMHKVLGFYASVIALVLALTGLAIDYDWMHNAMYNVANVGQNYDQYEGVHPVVDTNIVVSDVHPAMDLAFAETVKRSPHGEMFFVTPPSGKSDPITTGSYAKSLNYDHQDNYYFDPSNGKLLKSLPYSVKSAGMKFNEMNYGLHVGQYFNLPGKIAAFLVSLICASLPITGFMIWYGRKYKKHPRVGVPVEKQVLV